MDGEVESFLSVSTSWFGLYEGKKSGWLQMYDFWSHSVWNVCDARRVSMCFCYKCILIQEIIEIASSPNRLKRQRGPGLHIPVSPLHQRWRMTQVPHPSVTCQTEAQTSLFIWWYQLFHGWKRIRSPLKSVIIFVIWINLFARSTIRRGSYGLSF